jgi:hypothetical protein
MYQEEDEKELADHGFHISDGDDDLGDDILDGELPDDLDMGLDEEDPDRDS